MTTALTSAYQSTTEVLLKKDLHVPFSFKTLNKVRGLILAERCPILGLTAPGPTSYHVAAANHNGVLTRITYEQSTLCASGESFIMDFFHNGTTCLTGTITVSATTPLGFYDLSTFINGTVSINEGDQLNWVITYTAGGTPNHPQIALTAEWS